MAKQSPSPIGSSSARRGADGHSLTARVPPSSSSRPSSRSSVNDDTVARDDDTGGGGVALMMRARTIDYLTGPSPFDGLVTPIGSPKLVPGEFEWDERERVASPQSTEPWTTTATATMTGRDSPVTSVRLAKPPMRRRATTSAQFSESYFGKDMFGYDAQNGVDAYTFLPSHYGSTATFSSHPRGGPLPEHTFRRRVRLFWLQTISAVISTTLLLFIVYWALLDRCFKWMTFKLQFWKRNNKTLPHFDWEDEEKWKDESSIGNVKYYARSCGYDVVEQEIETRDGYFLKVYKVIVPHKPELHQKNGKGGYPVLIQHGLFQSAGSFVTSEERSLAFWLAEHGNYQVYLGNNRGVFDMGHKSLSRSDPRFWDYNIKEYALYDVPALVNHVLFDTGHSTLAYIGHSQGNATLFASLAQGMVPSLASKLSLFIALAPAVYAGPLTNGFPFGALKGMKWKVWRRMFGILDYIPAMNLSFNNIPGESKVKSWLGLVVFEFLFSWTDRNWLPRRICKMFRFTPTPVSSASIFWWTGFHGFSSSGCILDTEVETWYDERFPPLAIYHGGKDYLVLTQPLLDRLRLHEPHVRVVRIDEYEDGEHCDHFWHHSSPELFFHKFIHDIESTRPQKGSQRRSGMTTNGRGHVDPHDHSNDDLIEFDHANGQAMR